METFTRPDNVKVGPSKSSLVARLTPYGDGRPTQLALGGKRAYARYLLARKLAGNRYDNTSKQTYNNLDEALSRPFVSVKGAVLDYLSPAGLDLDFDEAAVATMLGEQARALAHYSRHYPIEDDDGNITGWRFDPGTIDPALKAEKMEALKYLGWDQHLFPFALDGAAEILTKRDVLLAAPMGTGKTRWALAVGESFRYIDGNTTPTIILANKRHLGAWKEELGGVPSAKPCELLVAQYGAACYEEWIEAADQPTFRKPFLLVSLDRAKIFTEAQLELFLEIAKTSSCWRTSYRTFGYASEGVRKLFGELFNVGSPWRLTCPAGIPIEKRRFLQEMEREIHELCRVGTRGITQARAYDSQPERVLGTDRAPDVPSSP